MALSTKRKKSVRCGEDGTSAGPSIDVQLPESAQSRIRKRRRPGMGQSFASYLNNQDAVDRNAPHPHVHDRQRKPTQEQQLYLVSERHPDMTPGHLRRWAMSEFTAPNESVLHEHSSITLGITNGTPMTVTAVEEERRCFLILEIALVNWINYVQFFGRHVTKEQVCSTAVRYAGMLHLRVDPQVFSTLWIVDFLLRHGLTLNLSVLKSDPMPLPVYTKDAISSITRRYCVQDVYAMDEMCLSYEMIPKRGNHIRSPASHRLITAVFCTNAVGNHRLEPLFVCQRSPPRSHSTHNSDHDASAAASNTPEPASTSPVFLANKKAWFTATGFRAWLRGLDNHMRL